jgi:NAD(P) transhydrogenase subunit alpha
MRIGAPKETRPLERRVAATPESIKTLRGLGYTVVVEPGAGAAAGYPDEAYVQQGAELGDAWAAEIIVKVQPPTPDEVAKAQPGALLISLLQGERHPGLVDTIAQRGLSALALERVPRITRAQKMDVLSSMANLAGYRAVIEAATTYGAFFGPQITAAGASPPAKVLIIGAGVAGLAALGAARALGAEVRAFDTRAAAREQVESLGGKFLEVTIQESGEGGGGYAKVMSPEFIAAEMALFRAQAKEVDVVITTALVPGTKAPTLLPRDVVECFRPGTVIVDMAAEQGGNCELTVPNEKVVHNGIIILGWTDLASRMAPIASRFFAANVAHLMGELGTATAFTLKLDDDVVRPSLVVHKGEVLPPLPPKPPSPTAVAPAPKKSVQPPPASAKPAQQDIMTPTRRAWGTTLGGALVIGLLFMLGRFAPPDFLRHSTVFVLACFVGWQVIWSVSPALHTPLMSVTNAISGIIIIGGMLQIGGELDLASALGALAVLLAAINVAGGFLVTHRMLKMFHREGPASSSSGHGHGGSR